MNLRHQRIYQGVRSNRYSGSKFTNWTRFHPWHSAVDKALWKDLLATSGERDRPVIVVEPAHRDFIRPLDRDDVEGAIAKVPREFLRGLQGIFVLGGSARHASALSLYCYGTYGLRRIFLAPFPKAFLCRSHRRELRPHSLHEWARAGATISRDGGVTRIEFTCDAVRRFYIRDVLMHEIGHHVDRCRDRSARKSEGFANWFAREYGYRRW